MMDFSQINLKEFLSICTSVVFIVYMVMKIKRWC